MEDLELFKRAFSHGYILATESPEEAREYEREFSRSNAKYATFFMKGLELGKAHRLKRDRGRGGGIRM